MNRVTVMVETIKRAGHSKSLKLVQKRIKRLEPAIYARHQQNLFGDFFVCVGVFDSNLVPIIISERFPLLKERNTWIAIVHLNSMLPI